MKIKKISTPSLILSSVLFLTGHTLVERALAADAILLEAPVIFTVLEQLPELPEHLSTPFADAQDPQIFSSAADLLSFFTDSSYELEQVRSTKSVPPLYVSNLPPDLNQLTVPQKTSLFIRLLFTSVLKVNTDIMTVREELISLMGKRDNDQPLSPDEQQWLTQVADDHQGSLDNLEDLLERVDILPVALIMAQAIDESGWGTSHFAIEGNALYGQHLSKDSDAEYITTASGNVRVASFDNLYHSTASYIHNLNTTLAYAKLRSDRADFRREHGELGEGISGEYLADSLLDYSERGQHYVDTLKWLIKHYRLDELEAVKLDSSDAVTLILFER